MVKSRVLSLGSQQAVVQDVVETVLKRRGHAVEAKATGPNAFTEVDIYDLVILEIDETDPEALAECVNLRSVSFVPLLLLIPSAARSQAIRGLELGADSFVVMPFDSRELAARCEALMRRYRQH